MKKLNIALVHDNLASPKQHIKGDAGYDLVTIDDAVLWPFQTKMLKSNVRMQLQEGFFARITGRSGLSGKGLLVHPGTIDSGYVGIIGIIMTNLSLLPKKIRKGERIAQFIIMKYSAPEIEIKAQLEPTERGARGFGSTGM